MTLRAYLIIIAIATILSFVTAGFVVAGTDPGTAPLAIFVILGASIFLGLAGVFAIIGLAARVFVLRKEDVVARQTVIAFRQAIILSAVIMAMIALRGEALLTWWNAALLILGATLLESLFISGK